MINAYPRGRREFLAESLEVFYPHSVHTVPSRLVQKGGVKNSLFHPYAWSSSQRESAGAKKYPSRKKRA